MGGIRKKTSKRGTTRQRASIQRKATTTRRRNGREAKKDVTWKSKKTADPGIPNNFPYKEQVLAELAEQKRLADEHKQQVRAAKKAAAKGPAAAAGDDSDADSEEENPGIIALHGRTPVNPSTHGSTSAPAPAARSPSASPPPDLVDTLLPTLQSALDRAHVILELVDARDPPTYRSQFLEHAILEGQESPVGKTARGGWTDKLLIVLNKVDLVPREAVQAWLAAIRHEFKGNPNVQVCAFKSSMTTMTSTRGPATDAATTRGVPIGKDGLLAILRSWAAEHAQTSGGGGGGGAADPLVVAVLGQPNVGKSSLINTLLGRPVHRTEPESKPSGTSPTTGTPVESSLPLGPTQAHPIHVIDTPGWEAVPPDVDAEMEKTAQLDETPDDGAAAAVAAQQAVWDALEQLVARDMLTRNLGRVDKVKDTFPLVKHLVHRVANVQDLMLAYTVPAFVAGDVEAFLTGVARSQGRLKKHGVPDLDGAARTILRDWSLGAFPYYTLPSSAKKAAAAAADAGEGGVLDAAVLDALKTRTEMKRELPRGLVRLKPGSVDDRELILDDEYGVEEDSEEDDEDENDDEDEDEDDDDEDDLDPEDDVEEGSEEGEEVVFSQDEEPSPSEDEDEEDEPVPAPAPASKKRKAAPEPASSKKRRVEAPAAPVSALKKQPAAPTAAEKKRRRVSESGSVAAAAPTAKKVKFARR